MRLVKRRSDKVGAPPGTLVHVGERRVEETQIRVISYGPDHLEERGADDLRECAGASEGVTWIAITGLHDVEKVQEVGEYLGLHPLVLEDILDTGHRPKVEEFDDYLFCVARAFDVDEGRLTSQQVSLILRSPLVISFEETASPLFDAVLTRLRAGLGRMRGAGADYLLYALLDSIVDAYFTTLEEIGDQTEDIEEAVVEDPSPDVLRDIHRLRSEVASIRRAMGPMREMLGWFGRGDSTFISAEWEMFLRDVYDHVIQAAEVTDSLRELLIGMLDIYLSSTSNRMNEVMKVLTIIATVFIPVTFVAGVYGMNFEWMPELHYRWGYPAALGVMFVMAVGMVAYFRRKKWL